MAEEIIRLAGNDAMTSILERYNSPLSTAVQKLEFFLDQRTKIPTMPTSELVREILLAAKCNYGIKIDVLENFPKEKPDKEFFDKLFDLHYPNEQDEAEADQSDESFDAENEQPDSSDTSDTSSDTSTSEDEEDQPYKLEPGSIQVRYQRLLAKEPTIMETYPAHYEIDCQSKIDQNQLKVCHDLMESKRGIRGLSESDPLWNTTLNNAVKETSIENGINTKHLLMTLKAETYHKLVPFGIWAVSSTVAKTIENHLRGKKTVYLWFWPTIRRTDKESSKELLGCLKIVKSLNRRIISRLH